MLSTMASRKPEIIDRHRAILRRWLAFVLNKSERLNAPAHASLAAEWHDHIKDMRRKS